jgi:hypothetical protein
VKLLKEKPCHDHNEWQQQELMTFQHKRVTCHDSQSTFFLCLAGAGACLLMQAQTWPQQMMGVFTFLSAIRWMEYPLLFTYVLGQCKTYFVTYVTTPDSASIQAQRGHGASPTNINGAPMALWQEKGNNNQQKVESYE